MDYSGIGFDLLRNAKKWVLKLENNQLIWPTYCLHPYIHKSRHCPGYYIPYRSCKEVVLPSRGGYISTHKIYPKEDTKMLYKCHCLFGSPHLSLALASMFRPTLIFMGSYFGAGYNMYSRYYTSPCLSDQMFLLLF